MIKYTFTINNLLICLHTPTSDLQKENIKKQPNKQTIQKNKTPTFFTQWPNISGCTSCKTGSTDSRALYRILTMTTCIITVVSIMTNVTFCEKNDGT